MSQQQHILVQSKRIRQLSEYLVADLKLFEDAIDLPQFFETNLVDKYRVVKYFSCDPQANIRIFYYQYLKLCFQIDNPYYQNYIQKFYQILRTDEFQFTFENNEQQKQLKNQQFKSLLINFFQLMNAGTLTIDEVLSQYPILDDIFINFFRTIVMLASVAQTFNQYIEKTILFDFLSSYFSIDITSYDKCLKFVQCDIFVFEENQQSIYMAYIANQSQSPQLVISDDINYQQSNETSKSNTHMVQTLDQKQTIGQDNTLAETMVQKIIPTVNSIQPVQILQPLSNAKVIIKQSYIEGNFSDYTSNANINAFGRQVQSTDQNEDKFMASIIDKITCFQTNSSGSHLARPFQAINEQQQKSLQRVLSTGAQAKKGQQQIQKNQLVKQLSQPSLLSSQFTANISINKEFNTKMSTNNNLYPTKDSGLGIDFQVKSEKLQLQSNKKIQNYEIFTTKMQQRGISNKQSRQRSLYNGLYQNDEQIFHKPIISIPTLISNQYKNSNFQKVKNHITPNYGQTKNKKFQLNVTKQFTNSFIMKNMKQTNSKNVYQCRERARQFRRNVYQQFYSKTQYDQQQIKIKSKINQQIKSKINQQIKSKINQQIKSKINQQIKSKINQQINIQTNLNINKQRNAQSKYSKQSKVTEKTQVTSKQSYQNSLKQTNKLLLQKGINAALIKPLAQVTHIQPYDRLNRQRIQSTITNRQSMSRYSQQQPQQYPQSNIQSPRVQAQSPQALYSVQSVGYNINLPVRMPYQQNYTNGGQFSHYTNQRK